MEESQRIEFIKALSQKKKGANPKDIVNELSLNISNNDLDSLVESLYAQDLISKPHPQNQSHSLPHFDKIIISSKGLTLINK